MLVKLLAIPILFFLPGLALTPGNFVFSLLFSLPITSLVLFLAAVTGNFSLPIIVLTNTAVSVFLLLLRRRFPMKIDQHPGFIPLLLAVALFVYFHPPFEYYFGGRDPGIYVVNGIRLAKTGGIIKPDPMVLSIPEKYQPLFFSEKAPVRFMGFHIDSLEKGNIIPNFLYLYPAWLGMFYLLFGLHGMLYATPFLACMMLLSFSLFVYRQMQDRFLASSALLLLGTNAITLWFSRYPNSEFLAGVLLFTGLIALDLYNRDPQPIAGIPGVLCLALAFWTRVDAALLLFPFVIWMAMRYMDGSFQKMDLVVAAIYALLLLAGLLYYVQINSQYILATFYNLRFKTYKVILVLSGLIAGAGGLAFLGKKYAWVQNPRAGKILGGLMTGLLVWAYCIRPFYPAENIGSPNAGALLALGWYFTHPLVILALMGVILYSFRFGSIQWLFFTAVLFYSILYFYRIRGHAEHFWMLRRYLMIICPALVFFSLYSIRTVLPRLRPLLVLVLSCLLSGYFLYTSRALHSHREFAGTYEFLEKLAGRVGPSDLLLLGSREGSDFHIVGPMLAYFFEKDVLQLRSSTPSLPLLTEYLKTRTGKVFYVGAGGDNLASADFSLRPVEEIRFETPVLDEIYHRRPGAVLAKYFQLGWYEIEQKPPSDPFFVDIGRYDDGRITNFHLKENYTGTTYRWTNGQGHVFFPPASSSITKIILQMNPGPWVPGMERVRVRVFANDHFLTEIQLGPGYIPYEIVVPESLRPKLLGVPLDIRIESPSWIPKRVLNLPDLRRVGVMVDWIRIILV